MSKHFRLEVIVAAIIFIILAGLMIFLLFYSKSVKPSPQTPTGSNETIKPPEGIQKSPEQTKKIIAEPISNAKARITKKPFGIYITPETSPVQPEKFTGFHTGTDFETTPGESGKDIPIFAICTGEIRVKEIVQGYGGVIVQDCTLENQPVTVIYGHLNIRQVQVLGVGAEVKSGDQISYLAPANGDLSGGERKHLHLGIHKGTNVDFRGYVQNKSELSAWLDIENLL